MWTPNSPSIQALHIGDEEQNIVPDHDDKDNATLEKLMTYTKSLPYSVEPNSKMQSLLDFYLMRFVQVSIVLELYASYSSCLPSVSKRKTMIPVCCNGTL